MTKPILDRISLPVGERVFSEGDDGDQAFIVKSGMVEIYKQDNGKKIVFSHVGAGGIFGEMALIDSQPRMATAHAVEPCTLIVISRQKFEEKMAKTDPFVRGLLKIFTGNLRAMSHKEAVPNPV